MQGFSAVFRHGYAQRRKDFFVKLFIVHSGTRHGGVIDFVCVRMRKIQRKNGFIVHKKRFGTVPV